MPDFDIPWSWMSLVALGSFHGLNPAMGWLFAVALGIQERRLRGVATALAPIAVGHAAAISAVAVVIWMVGAFIPQGLLLLLGGVSMLLFAGYKLLTRFRHTTWIGMRVKRRELIAWSFLMATAHGAGLMLVPALMTLRDTPAKTVAAHSQHAQHIEQATGAGGSLAISLLAVGVHTAAMLTVSGAIAVIVYQRIGVDVLRRAWVNLDLIWFAALVLAGVATLAIALIQLVA